MNLDMDDWCESKMERLLIIVNGSFVHVSGEHNPGRITDLPLPQGFCTLPTDAVVMEIA